MKEPSVSPALSALIPGSPGDLAYLLPALAACAALAAASAVARNRSWTLAVRRALTFFLLLSLVVLVSGVLPAHALAAARPGLLVAASILLWVGLLEGAQALVIDFALVGWLGRPPVPRILRDFATFGFALAVFLISLRGTLGVNLSSLLATSAMISVVLGLAMQDTLGSFFAGLALQMEAPLAIGDWIQIGEHQGRVSQVGWRTLRIVNLDGDEITFPNSLVTRSTLANFSRPTREHRAFVAVSAHYRHPPQQVLTALTEAMRGVSGVLARPAAHAVVWDYGESGIVYRARYWIEDFDRVNLVRSDVAARIWYGLRRAGIEPAFPARVLSHAPAAPDSAHDVTRIAGTLGGVDLLAPLSAAERLLLAERLHPLLYGPGEIIIRQGERGDSCFVVVRGSVEVRVATDDEEAIVSALGAGSVFGEMSLLTGGPRTATVAAVEDTEVLAVTSADFARVVAANPAVLDQVARVVGGRRDRLAEAIRETEDAAAARTAAHHDLLDRVRKFFGVPRG